MNFETFWKLCSNVVFKWLLWDVAYVFKDLETESQYLAARAFTRRLEYRTDLIAEFSKSRLARRYVAQATRLGRLPLPEEFPKFDRLLDTFGSSQRIARLALRHIDYEAFSGSQAQRREDILTYLAMVRLQGLKPLSFFKLPRTVQADVKAVWKTYRAALTEGERYLFSLGDPEIIKKCLQFLVCRQALTNPSLCPSVCRRRTPCAPARDHIRGKAGCWRGTIQRRKNCSGWPGRFLS